MTGCNTGRNIQKYKGSGGTASTLQDALENSNVATLDINLISGAVYIGDGGGLSNISAGSTSGNLQSVTNNGATTTNKITFSNSVTSLETSGNALVTGNVTAGPIFLVMVVHSRTSPQIKIFRKLPISGRRVQIKLR